MSPLEGNIYASVLELPEVRALQERLEAEGYAALPDAVSTGEFFGTQFAFIPFSKEGSSEERGARETFLPRRLPKATLPLESMAYVVHWDGGTIGVLPMGSGVLRVLYPDVDRAYRVVPSPSGLLEQLRENERFISFERWLLNEHPLRRSVSSPLQLFVSQAFLDEALGVVYILLVFGEIPSGDPGGYLKIYQEDESLEPLREYLVLAKAIGEINGDILIDPDTIWLLPREDGENEGDPWAEGIPRQELIRDSVEPVNLRIPQQLHVVRGFGAAPEEFGDLRSFGFVVPRDSDPFWLAPEPTPQPRSREARLPFSQPECPPFGVELYVWSLVDRGPENLVLRFVPSAELALATYNTFVESNAPSILAAHEPGKNILAILAGFEGIDVAKVKNLYAELEGAAHAVTQPLSNQGLLYSSAAGFDLFARSIGVDAEELIRSFLKLAEADEVGTFPELYAELTPQGLGKFVEWLIDVNGFTEAEARATVRTMSHYTYLFAQELGFRTSSKTPLEPKGYVHVLFIALKSFLIHLKEWAPVIASALETMDIIGEWVRDPESMPDIVDVVETTNRLLEALRRNLLTNISHEEAVHITNLIEARLGSIGPRVNAVEQLNRLIIILGLARFFPPTPEGTRQYVEFLKTYARIVNPGGWTLGGIITAERISGVKKISSWIHWIWELNELPDSFPALVYWRFEPEPNEHWTKAGTWVIAAVRHFDALELTEDYGQKVLVPGAIIPISGGELDIITYWAKAVFSQFSKFNPPEAREAHDRLHIAVFVFKDDAFDELLEEIVADPSSFMDEVGASYFDDGALYLVWEEPWSGITCDKVLRYFYVGNPENRLAQHQEWEYLKALIGDNGCLSSYDPDEDQHRVSSEADPHAMAMVLAGAIEEASGEDIWDGDPDDPPMPMSQG
ncbi:hypothetical protein ACVNPS_04690 [Candidatus Bipolaricaulota sp. J31]